MGGGSFAKSGVAFEVCKQGLSACGAQGVDGCRRELLALWVGKTGRSSARLEPLKRAVWRHNRPFDEVSLVRIEEGLHAVQYRVPAQL